MRYGEYADVAYMTCNKQ